MFGITFAVFAMDVSKFFGFLIGSASLAFVVFLVWNLIKYPLQKARNDREVIACLAQRLRPLSPTHRELAEILNHLTVPGQFTGVRRSSEKRHLQIAKLKPREILEAIEEAE